jgi:hypothetical protein
MDQELRTLSRAAAEDPTDEAAARRYDAALLQVGDRARVQERFRWKFQCPLRWTDMAATADPAVKHCGTCDRDVHAARDEKELRAHVLQGRCVAFPEALHRQAFEGLEDEKTLHSAKDPARPCVVLGGAAPPREIPLEAIDALPEFIAHRFRIVPVAVKEGRVVVAVSPQRLYRLDRVRRDGRREIEAVLVSEDELGELYESYVLTQGPRRMVLGELAPPG